MSPAKKSRPKKKSSLPAKFALRKPNSFTAIQRLLRFIGDDLPISSIYWASTQVVDIPSYPKIEVLWLGCGENAHSGYHDPEYYLVEIMNPDLLGRRCTVDLFDIGLQPENPDVHATIEQILDGENILIANSRLPSDLHLCIPPVNIDGTKYDSSASVGKRTLHPYTLTFTGLRCVLKVKPPAFPHTKGGNDQGSPPPPYSGGRPFNPKL